MSQDIQQIIAKTQLFRGLKIESQQKLSQLLTIRHLKKKENLFLEGDQGKAIFLLERGAIQLSKTSENGREIVIKTVKPGEMFAEAILFEKSSYPVSAFALAACRLLVLVRQDILELIEEKNFRHDFIAMLMQKHRYLTERIRYLTSFDIEQRFIRFIFEQYGQRNSMQIKLSKKDIAGSIGATPETLSRLIQRLQESKLIDWQGDNLKIASELWLKHQLT